MKRRLKRIIALVLTAAIAVATLLACWILWANSAAELNTYTVKSEALPEEFNGFRIAQVSDLHNEELGRDNKRLLELLSQAKPDIIVITGDMLDSRRTDTEAALSFAREALKIAPCYYVSGNHEARISEYSTFAEELADLGVELLNGKQTTLCRQEAEIELCGIDDPAFFSDPLLYSDKDVAKGSLEGLSLDKDRFTVLLSHRPELFDLYCDFGVDLVFSGHAHGGQVRLPLVGGLVAPDQGLFPEYDGGFYKNGDTVMLVSRGIGNSIIPLRLFNRPEVVVAELVKK